MSNLFDVDTGAEAKAKEFVIEKTTSSQLRNFYNEFKSLERTYILKYSNNKTKEDAFKDILPQVKLTKAKVSYARGRNTVKESFESWLKSCVNNINSFKEFEDFMLHFEAIVGYAYGFGLKD